MFLLNEILVFAQGRRREALDRLDWIHGLMADKPGFREAIVAKDLGHHTRHTIMRVWDDEAAYQAFRAGPDGNYGRNRPEGLYTNEQVVPQWNSVAEHEGKAQGKFLAKIQRPTPGLSPEVSAQHTRQYDALLESLGGYVSRWTFRAKDKDELLVVVRLAHRDAFEEMMESPDFVKMLAAAPDGYGDRTVGCYEIVSEVFPKKA